jgi:hypothetical protein
MKQTVRKEYEGEKQKLVDAMKRKESGGSVLVLSGSMSEDGNTDAILENLIDGMHDASFQVSRVRFIPHLGVRFIPHFFCVKV